MRNSVSYVLLFLPFFLSFLLLYRVGKTDQAVTHLVQVLQLKGPHNFYAKKSSDFLLNFLMRRSGSPVKEKLSIGIHHFLDLCNISSLVSTTPVGQPFSLMLTFQSKLCVPITYSRIEVTLFHESKSVKEYFTLSKDHVRVADGSTQTMLTLSGRSPEIMGTYTFEKITFHLFSHTMKLRRSQIAFPFSINFIIPEPQISVVCIPRHADSVIIGKKQELQITVLANSDEICKGILKVVPITEVKVWMNREKDDESSISIPDCSSGSSLTLSMWSLVESSSQQTQHQFTVEIKYLSKGVSLFFSKVISVSFKTPVLFRYGYYPVADNYILRVTLDSCISNLVRIHKYDLVLPECISLLATFGPVKFKPFFLSQNNPVTLCFQITQEYEIAEALFSIECSLSHSDETGVSEYSNFSWNLSLSNPSVDRSTLSDANNPLLQNSQVLRVLLESPRTRSASVGILRTVIYKIFADKFKFKDNSLTYEIEYQQDIFLVCGKTKGKISFEHDHSKDPSFLVSSIEISLIPLQSGFLKLPQISFFSSNSIDSSPEKISPELIQEISLIHQIFVYPSGNALVPCSLVQ